MKSEIIIDNEFFDCVKYIKSFTFSGMVCTPGWHPEIDFTLSLNGNEDSYKLYETLKKTKLVNKKIKIIIED